VGERCNVGEQIAFTRNTFGKRQFALRQRVTAARLGVTFDQRFSTCLQIDQLDLDTAAAQYQNVLR
jgi:hypothetical protein